MMDNVDYIIMCCHWQKNGFPYTLKTPGSAVTRKRVHSGQTPFRVNDDPEISQIDPALGHISRQVDWFPGHRWPGMEFGPNGPFSRSRWPGCFYSVPRFILADVPFQNMSLHEEYSDEEQRSSKHENCRHINLIITIFANFRACIWPQLTVRYTCPVPSLRLLSLEYYEENREN